jgi:NADPH:quinone reductase-like Zn-dependent oxidoreductase
VHAAVLQQFGTPVYREFEEPVAAAGQVVVDVAAAGLNPVDLRKADGTYLTGPPPLPSVAGTEAVGTVVGSGRRVYVSASIPPFGTMAQRTLAVAEALFDVPDALDDGHAVALGIAGLAGWLPLAWRAQLKPGETVLVLGATGAVGRIAVQAAKLLGAGRVVAAGRDPEGLRALAGLGADATVQLDASDDLAGAFREAAGGDVDLVVDPLWGAPAVAALEALGVGGRLVQLGQSAGAEAAVPSVPVRGKLLDIRGYLNFRVPAEVQREAYRALTEHAAAGRIAVDVEQVPLRDVADAWARQRSGAGRKLVLVP